MNTSSTTARTARLLLVALTGVLVFAIVGAPLFSRHAHPVLGAFLYLLFSPICHQLPQRSFMLDGMSWAVCQRCAGIYMGMFAAALLVPARWWASVLSAERRRTWALLSAAPLAADALLPRTGHWASTPASRFLTGILFGVMLMTLLLPGVAECLRTLRARPADCAQSTEPQGGFS